LVLLDHYHDVCIKTYNKGESAVYVYTFLWGWYSWIRASYYSLYGNSQRDATVYQNFLLFHVYIKLNMFWVTHRPSSGAQNCTSSLWLLDVVVAAQRPATTTSNNLSRMQNQRLLVQFWAPDDGRCVARNMLSFM
jgi:hypothetical protein